MNESKKDIELRQKIQNRLQIMSGYHSRTYDYIKEQLEFVSGNQWDSSVLSARELDKRPSVVLNLTKTYVNRVVNPVRMNPIGIRINTDNPELTEFTTGVIREVEANSRAQEAYEVREDIYKKRHITIDIPSTYGSYHEMKFDCLGLTFRIEALVNVLFEELIAKLELRLVREGLEAV